MNDQQIYMLMAKTPNIRAVQIADALDKDLSDVSNALRSLVEVGDVSQSKGFSPNGMPAQIYNLSDAYKKSRDYGVVMEMLAAADAKAKAVAVAATPPAAAPVDVPVFAQAATMPVSQGSKADRGVAYIIAHSPASDSDLRTVMGITKPGAPAAYLTAAIRTGKVHKGVNGWMPGRSTPTPSGSAFNRSITKAKPGPVAQFDATAQPDDVKDLPAEVLSQLTKPAQVLAAAASMASPVFRCGMWSDGVLELQRDGRSLVELTRREGELLAEFMSRMLGAVESTQF